MILSNLPFQQPARKLRKYLTDAHLQYAFAVVVTDRNGSAALERVERITSA